MQVGESLEGVTGQREEAEKGLLKAFALEGAKAQSASIEIKTKTSLQLHRPGPHSVGR